MTRFAETADDLVVPIADGSVVALPPDYSGCAMAAMAALAERRVRNLHLVGVPSLGFGADMLIASGAVAVVEAAAMGLGEYGAAPAFEAALHGGRIAMRDATCPAIHAGLQAAERGVDSMPVAGIVGSDLVRHRRDEWRVVPDPFTGRPTVHVRAIRPDVALFHAAVADRAGNVWIGVRRELMTMAHAARRTLVTVERIVDDDLLADDRTAAGTIPSLYVDAVAAVRFGARPLGLRGEYDPDETALRAYVEAARAATRRVAA